jgi:hypothetical protein
LFPRLFLDKALYLSQIQLVRCEIYDLAQEVIISTDQITVPPQKYDFAPFSIFYFAFPFKGYEKRKKKYEGHLNNSYFGSLLFSRLQFREQYITKYWLWFQGAPSPIRLLVIE